MQILGKLIPYLETSVVAIPQRLAMYLICVYHCNNHLAHVATFIYFSLQI